MKTILRGRTREVEINTEGPVVIIGECINPTRRKKLVTTLQEGNFEYMLELAEKQIKAGADVLDVNVGFPGVNDEQLLPETVKVLQDKFDVPLCLDSPNPKAVEAALKVASGKCLINSVNGEEASLNALLPVAKEYGAVGFKINGAGGGGSATVLAGIGNESQLKKKYLENGFQVLPIKLDFNGVQTWEA